jgi:predicted dehydrogenase
MTNFGIIGAGHGVRVLAPAIDIISGARLVALATRSESSLNDARQTLDLETYTTDWRDLIEADNIDAVAIAVPAAAQSDIAVAALNAGKLVFLEKPLSTTLAGAETIAAAADRNQQSPVVDFIFPMLDPWRTLHATLQQHDIGDIKDFKLVWRTETYANKHMLDNWKTRQAEGGGTLLNFASHSFHYLSWLFGETASLQVSLSKPDDDPRDGDTRVEGEITFTNGAKGTIEIDAAHTGAPCHRITVHGTQGTLILGNSTRDYVRGFSLVNTAEPDDPVVDTEIESYPGDGRIIATARILDTFLRTKSFPPGLGVHDALKTQRLLDAARQSHLSGRRIVAGPDYQD